MSLASANFIPDGRRRAEVSREWFIDYAEHVLRAIDIETHRLELRGWITKSGRHILIGDDGGGSSGGAGGKAAKKVDKSQKPDIIKLKDIEIGKSVGAKAKNYDILDPATGEYFNFAEGTKIQNAEVFAGKGCKKPLDRVVAEGLAKQIGGKAENWQHAKGHGIIDYYGEERPAEVHWFQEKSVGKHKFKIKRWED